MMKFIPMPNGMREELGPVDMPPPATLAEIKATLADDWAKFSRDVAGADLTPFARLFVQALLIILAVGAARTVRAHLDNRRKRTPLAHLPHNPTSGTGLIDFTLGEPALWTTDPVAAARVLDTTDPVFRPLAPHGVLRTLGVPAGDANRKGMAETLARALAPTDAAAALDAAYALREHWADKGTGREEKMDLLGPAHILALNAYGACSLGVDFGAFASQHRVVRLAEAARKTAHSQAGIAAAQDSSPQLGWIPMANRRATKRLAYAIEALCQDRVLATICDVNAARRERLQTLGTDAGTGPEPLEDDHNLLEALVRQRHWPVKEEHRLGEYDVVGPVAVVLTDGATATANLIAETLHALALRPEVQSRLRTEVQAVNTDRPDLQTLMSLPFLSAVTCEAQRLHPLQPVVVRESTATATIPLATPLPGSDGGAWGKEVRVLANTKVFVSYTPAPEDASFYPDHTPTTTTTPAPPPTPSVAEAALAALSAPAELILRAALFVLLRAFSFAPAPDTKIEHKTVGLYPSPCVAGESGAQLPLLVRDVTHAKSASPEKIGKRRAAGR